MLLFHLGYQVIEKPDIHYGRKNADFGQGFYLTAQDEFAGKWAKERKEQQPVLNTYEMDLTGLEVHRFVRDAHWYDYICNNRAGRRDTLGADVIIGPIANDTIYDTLGIFTSGILKREEALELLMIGPEYTQVAVKTEKAAKQLRWIRSERIGRMDAEQLKAEQDAYQEQFALELEAILDAEAEKGPGEAP